MALGNPYGQRPNSSPIMEEASNGEDILELVIIRKLQGVMIHNDLKNGFDYLNMHGFKRQQEYRSMDEMSDFNGLTRYMINRHDKMFTKNVERVQILPMGLETLTSRFSISADQKKQFVKSMFENWHEWEKETVELLEKYATELAKTERNVDAHKIKELLLGTSKELKYLERQVLEYSNVDWSLHHLYCCQEELHSKYKSKLEEGFKIEMC